MTDQQADVPQPDAQPTDAPVLEVTAAQAQPEPADEWSIEEPTPIRGFWASMSAVVVKELRWRMRGRRAYIVVTAYVGVLGLLVFFVYQSVYDQSRLRFAEPGFEGDAVSGLTSAAIGQSIFGVILILQTLLTLLVSPALTSGAISLEREKQTLELLITTPVSTLGMVVGKLVSSLAYVVLLILASIPLMSLVFVFGGIAPDDVIRAYVLLFVVAFGIGSIGLFLSAWLKRTQLATAISFVIVFVVSFAAPIFHAYLLASSVTFDGDQLTTRTPPEPIVWLSAIAADIDVLCTAIPESYNVTCNYTGAIRGFQVDPNEPPRDAFWPRSAAAFTVLGIVLTLGTTQLISKSRRLRPTTTPPPPPEVFGPVPT